MSRIPHEGLIPRADRLLIQTFPKVAKRLHNQGHGLDKAAMEAFLKLLPDAVERHQSQTTQTNDLHESVVSAITQLQTSFGSRSAVEAESSHQSGTVTRQAEPEEAAGGVSGLELPNEPGTGGDGGLQGPEETEG